MEIKPGKYRMANGEQAVVRADVGENPIGAQDDYPLKGFTKKGPTSWSRNGRRYSFCGDPQDLREPWVNGQAAAEKARTA